MKTKSYSFFLAILSLVLGLSLNSCNKPEKEPSPVSTIELGTIGINTLDILINNTDKSTEFAYKLSTDLNPTAPEATILFGTGTKGSLVEGENTIKISELEGNTDYVIYIATKTADKFNENVTTLNFKTLNYTETITIIERLFDGVSYHILVPEGKKVTYASMNTENYLTFKQIYGLIDYDLFLDPNTGFVDSKILDKSTTIVDNQMEDPDTGEMIRRYVPGESITIILSEVVEDAENPGKYKPAFDLEACRQEGKPEDECWEGVHARTRTNAKAPILNEDVKVEAKQIRQTTRTVEFKITPDAEVIQYVPTFIDMATWNMFEELLGYDGMISTLSTFDAPQTGTTSLTCAPLQLGISYKLVVIGRLNNDGTENCITIVDFEAKEATKDAPVITITPIDNPSGTNSAFQVWFNIKAPNSDLISAKYAANSIPAFQQVLSGGMTYFQLVDSQGNPFTEEQVEEINSTTGYNISFGSYEDTWTRLAVVGYNDEEVSNMPNPDVKGDGWNDNKTIEEPAIPEVSSTLYDELAGDWTVEALLYEYEWLEDGTKVEKLAEKPTIAKTSISRSLAEYSATCPQEVYTAYSSESKEFVDDLYAKFLESSKKYNRKVKGQNRMICQGFDVKGLNTAFKSPFDLLIDQFYSSYDTDELFFDFGPKYYLEIQENDKVILPVDASRIAPVSAHGFQEIFFTGASDKAYDMSITHFDVTVSEDKQTITINPLVKDGVTYYPSLISVSYGFGHIIAKCHSIVIKKGWTEPTTQNNQVNSILNNYKELNNKTFSPRLRKTYIPNYKKAEYKEVTISEFTFDK